MKRRWIVLLCMTAMAAIPARAAETAQDVLDNVGKKYDSITDARVTFSQKVSFELANIKENTTGTLLFKKEHKYRLELDEQTIVTDGQTVWKYSVPQKQVLIDRFKSDDQSFSPERILTGAPSDYSPTLIGKDRVGKTETLVLKLLATRDDAFVQSLKLWVDSSTWLIKKVEYVDASGKQTEYTVNDIKINLGLDDSRFTYKIPEGVDVVDLR